MAQRRMFSKKIVETDYFMEMSPTAKLFYFYLNMSADDDGFVGNPKMIKMVSGATDDDFKILVAKQFILLFESGVIVVKDWRIHNYIQKDRYNKTQYTDEKSQLIIEENGTYTKCIQDGYGLDTQVRLGKVRLGKDNINTMSDKSDDVKEIINYLNEKASTNYRPSSAKTKSLIGARYKEGYTLDDFKKVIDNKVAEWLTNKDMCKFLRPETLFGPKFEGYLNQNNVGSKTNNQDTSQYDGMF